MMLTMPVIGPVVVLGHLAAMVLAAVQGAVVVGGLGALGAALYSIGLPKDSVIQYEAALKSNGFLIVAHGPAEEMARATEILKAANPSSFDLHEDVKDQAAPARAHSGHHAAA